ncbi:MAG: acetolactate decarboxylase [Rhodopirellula sp. JB053]|uniref:acetolactate decarboxylase n=1 Tax=Rhodopirellula sp. JB044 TaxID=3342844 RepID=UPI00370BDD2B
MSTPRLLSAASIHLFGLGIFLAISTFSNTSARADHPQDTSIVHFGKMHEAIGKHQDHGRVSLSKLTSQKNFYAVAALAGLHGEVTIDNGNIVITGVDDKGRIKPLPVEGDEQATMLVGAYVANWSEHKVNDEIQPADFDAFIADTAQAAGIDTDKPFVFRITGVFTQVRMHVIHGACPIHARMTQQELPADEKAYESTQSKVSGSVIGVYAKDAVGSLTHPATSTHLHIIYQDEESGDTVTAHVEQIGLAPDATVMFPK